MSEQAPAASANGGFLGAVERIGNKLPDPVRTRLTLENDDRVYTPEDLLPICMETGIPLVYDAHHHRCLPDALSIEKASEMAVQTWNREPVFHISSPLNGWDGASINQHHDYIDPLDFPECWLKLNITVEVEAKAKELAVLKLKKQIDHLTSMVSPTFGTTTEKPSFSKKRANERD